MAVNIDKNTIEHSGTISTQMSELALGLHDIARRASKTSFASYEECIDEIIRSTRLYKLTDAGMNIKEAMEVLGMDPSKIILSESVIPEDQREALNEANHTQTHRTK